MRTLALVFLLTVFSLALLINILKGARTVSDSRSSIVAGALSILMMLSAIYLYNTGDAS
jgi:hypothetical protein